MTDIPALFEKVRDFLKSYREEVNDPEGTGVHVALAALDEIAERQHDRTDDACAMCAYPPDYKSAGDGKPMGCAALRLACRGEK